MALFKVIAVDNYDRETVSDKLIKDNLSEQQAKVLAKDMNDEADDKYGDNAPYYYMVVDNDHKLYDATSLYYLN